MSNKSIQNRLNVKEFFRKATDKDYFNLFQPVIPKIDLTGKIAQVISALTESVTIWLICQSKLSDLNKVVVFLISVMAVILVVTAIEIGGRKCLQVLTRAIIWKRLTSFWYWILFLFILAITGFLFWQSYGLSTKGIDKTFEQSVKMAVTLDDTPFLERHGNFVKEINTKYDNQNKTLSNAFILNFDAKEKEYISKIDAVQNLIEEHANNKEKGVKWANSHLKKQTKIKNALVTEKESKLSELTTNHTKDLKVVESARLAALDKEDVRYKTAVEKAEKALNQNHGADKEQANFWGNLFSNLVGFMIALAFVCIIITEIFRRGAGIEIDYEENELPPTILNVFIAGLNNRTFNLTYNLAQKWYVEKREFDFFPSPNIPRTIGFNIPSVNNQDESVIHTKMGHRIDILDLNKLNKRDKEKFKAKQEKRIVTYYHKYVEKNGVKPSYQIISNALGISVNTVGKYIRKLKDEGNV